MLAKKEREIYLENMKTWKEQFSHMKRKPKIIHKHGRRPDRPKLPLNAYFMFKRDIEPTLVKQKPELRGPARAIELGSR